MFGNYIYVHELALALMALGTVHLMPIGSAHVDHISLH